MFTDPKDQYQLQDLVVYKVEGVYTRIEDYVWHGGDPPRILAYKLSCGISVTGDLLRRLTPEEEQRLFADELFDDLGPGMLPEEKH